MSSHTLKRDSESTCLGKTDILTPGTSHGEDLDAKLNMKLCVQLIDFIRQNIYLILLFKK